MSLAPFLPARRVDLRPLALPALIVALWSLVSARGSVNPDLLPTPGQVLRTFRGLLGSASYWNSLGLSLGRALTGFAAGSILGLALGVPLGASKWAHRILAPSFHGFRQVAVFAWIPLISAWLGQGEATKLVFITLATFPFVAVNSIEGVHAVTREHRDLARALQLGPWQRLRFIIAPSALPQILTGLHLALVVAWLATVGAEYFLQVGAGITLILIEGRGVGRMDLLFAGIATVGLVGLALNVLLGLVERRLLRGRPVRSTPGA